MPNYQNILNQFRDVQREQAQQYQGVSPYGSAAYQQFDVRDLYNQAKQEIARYNSDKTFMTAYASGDHTGHKEAVTRMDSLYKLAYPDETPGTTL